LKPENIKVSRDGFVKILDFGVAKRVTMNVSAGLAADALTVRATAPGIVLGTAGYMSPEQARGGPVEFPSDQFSFGAVLYEMLTGRRAFERPTFAETLSAVIREEPRRISALTPAVPPPVRWIVERCLAKSPEERYALTRDLARDLASVREHLSELLASRRTWGAARAPGHASIAVLPVANLSGDPSQEPLADALTDALIAELTQCPGLHVLSRSASMVYKDRRITVPDVAEELDVKWILLASMTRAGREVRITAQLVDGGTDENRWAHSYTRSPRSVLSMQSEVAAAVAASVSAALTSRPARHPAGIPA
jgi:TolB-like protein